MISTTMKTMLDTIVANELKLSVVLLNEMNGASIAGLNGFKRFFRYRSMDRSRHAIMLCNFCTEFVDIELDLTMSVPTMIASRSLKTSLLEYHTECVAQLETLKTACSTAATENEIMLMGHLSEMITDQSEELMRLKRILLSLDLPEMDLRCYDQELHCKYKEKEKEKFGYSPTYAGKY